MVVQRVTASVVRRQVRHVVPVPVASAAGLVANVYAQVAEEMRIVPPPALLHSPSPEVLAAFWALFREPLAGTAADRLTKEAVAAAVSVANACPYCAQMHTAGVYELGTADDAEALADDRVGDIADHRLRAVAAWARHAHRAGSTARLPADVGAAERAELVALLVAFHYTARMVNVFLPTFLFPPRLGPGGRRRLQQGLGRLLRPVLRKPRPVGRATALLPPAGGPGLAAPAARVDAAFEAAGRRAVPPAVRELVAGHVAGWRGEDPGFGSGWCEDAIAPLAPGDRPAARLALLTALVSHRVTDEVVEAFRRRRPDDAGLVDTAAWASHLAATTIGRRI